MSSWVRRHLVTSGSLEASYPRPVARSLLPVALGALVCCAEAPRPLPTPPPCHPVEIPADSTEAERRSCAFSAGATPTETLGVGPEWVAEIPITHVIVRMQENRSFDHYLGQLPRRGHPEVDGLPESFTNPDLGGAPVAPFPLASTCLEADPPHQWDAMNAQWNRGSLDGFVRTAAVGGSDGRYTMGYYDEADLPFYYWLAKTFVVSDRYFSSSLGGTWSNRNFLYTGSAHGVKNTFDRVISDAESIFDRLDAAGVDWAVYVQGRAPRQDTLGWNSSHPGLRPFAQLLERLADGTLEPVVFVETSPGAFEDEHPPFDVQPGEAWTAELYHAARYSPLWARLAIFLNYDTAGGMLDHVPPPEACPPSPEETDFAQLGFRVPFVVVSAWAKPGYVSHEVHDHTSVLRFVELLHGIDALSDRDANADALLDVFDFGCPAPFPVAPEAPAPGFDGLTCRTP